MLYCNKKGQNISIYTTPLVNLVTLLTSCGGICVVFTIRGVPFTRWTNHHLLKCSGLCLKDITLFRPSVSPPSLLRGSSSSAHPFSVAIAKSHILHFFSLGSCSAQFLFPLWLQRFFMSSNHSVCQTPSAEILTLMTTSFLYITTLEPHQLSSFEPS